MVVKGVLAAHISSWHAVLVANPCLCDLLLDGEGGVWGAMHGKSDLHYVSP